MKELIERLREDYCSCIDGYKSRGMTDPQCSSCDSKDWREECADALESLTKALDFWKNGHIEMTAELFAVKRAQDTAVDEYIKSEEKVIALTAERDALKAALQLIKANTNTIDWPDDINAAIQGAGK